MLLFCPHCGDVIEIFGLAPPRLPECRTCGAALAALADRESQKAFKTSFEAVFGKPGQER